MTFKKFKVINVSCVHQGHQGKSVGGDALNWREQEENQHKTNTNQLPRKYSEIGVSVSEGRPVPAMLRVCV